MIVQEHIEQRVSINSTLPVGNGGIKSKDVKEGYIAHICSHAEIDGESRFVDLLVTEKQMCDLHTRLGTVLEEMEQWKSNLPVVMPSCKGDTE